MKVICIDNSGCPELVVGHIYSVEKYDKDSVIVDCLQFDPESGESVAYEKNILRNLSL